MEQATGIEPAYQAWEACALPLSYACMKTAGRMPLLSGVPSTVPECSFIAGHSDIIHATPEKVNSPGQTK